jgi:hypothetical protein
MVDNPEEVPSHQNLDLFFDVEAGFYIDYRSYYSLPGANAKNIKLLKKYFSDFYGFSIQRCNLEYPCFQINGKSTNFISHFNSFDDMINVLHVKNIAGKNIDYVPFEHLKYNIIFETKYHEIDYSYEGDIHPLAAALNKMQEKKLKLISYKIPTADILYSITYHGLVNGVAEDMYKKYGPRTELIKYQVGENVYFIAYR